MIIELTAPTRVLLETGTRVNVSKATGDVIIALGRAIEIRADEKVSKKPNILAESEEAPEEEAEKPKSKKKSKKE